MSRCLGGDETAPPSKLQSRLWKVATALLIFLVSTIATARYMGPKTDLIGMPGADLLPSYMAGEFVRTGHPGWLMDLPRQAEWERQIRIDQHLGPKVTMPWLNPPYYAWVFVPLSVLPFREALAVWFGLNVIMTAGSIALLATMAPKGSGWRTWGLIAIFLVCSFPFLQVLASEQNTCLSLLLLSATVVCWRNERAYLAGAIAGLLLFKPQLGALIIAALCVCLGWRAIVGVATTGLTLLAITLITMHGALGDYFTKLPAMLPWAKAGGTFLWERQTTWLGFWRLMLHYRATGPATPMVQLLATVGAMAMAGMLAYTVIRIRQSGIRSSDRLIAALITAMPAVMPYYMDYDLLLLAIPVVLLAGESLRDGGLDTPGAWLGRSWMALYVWLFFNAGVADTMRFNLLVPVLAAMATGQCIRAMRIESARAIATTPESQLASHFHGALPSAERAA